MSTVIRGVCSARRGARPRFGPALLAAALVLAGGCGDPPETVKAPARSASEARPAAARLALDPEGKLRISAEDRCAVCGMLPAAHPEFAAAVELAEGETYYFCGPGCALKAWHDPKAYLGVAPDRLARGIARDYFGGAPLDFLDATWVRGSDVIGPMGPALVPLKDAADEATFLERHGGEPGFRLEGLDEAGWNELLRKKGKARAE